MLAFYIKLVAYQKGVKILDNTNLMLVDMEDYFCIIGKNQKIKIDYSLYSMMIGSIDFDKVTSVFNTNEFIDIIGNYAEMRSTLNFIEVNKISFKKQKDFYLKMENSISDLYVPLRKCLTTGHLNSLQLSCITKLFIHEFTIHMSSDYFQWDNPKTYVPSVLCNTQLKDHINGLLKRETKNLSAELQKEFNNLELITNMKIIKGIPYTMYHITSTLDFLLIDLQRYLKKIEITAKECKYCERLFLPTKRSNSIYCRLPHDDTDKTCNYIMHHTPKDDIEALYIYAKRQQGKFRDYPSNIDKYGYVFLDTIYNEWKDECDKQYAKTRRTQDKHSFEEWIKNTSFKKKRLEELYQKYTDIK